MSSKDRYRSDEESEYEAENGMQDISDEEYTEESEDDEVDNNSEDSKPKRTKQLGKDVWTTFLLQKLVENLHYFDQRNNTSLREEWAKLFRQTFPIYFKEKSPTIQYFVTTLLRNIQAGSVPRCVSTIENKINFKKIKEKVLVIQSAKNTAPSTVKRRSLPQRVEQNPHQDDSDADSTAFLKSSLGQAKNIKADVARQESTNASKKIPSTPKMQPFQRRRAQTRLQEESDEESSEGAIEPPTSKNCDSRMDRNEKKIVDQAARREPAKKPNEIRRDFAVKDKESETEVRLENTKKQKEVLRRDADILNPVQNHKNRRVKIEAAETVAPEAIHVGFGSMKLDPSKIKKETLGNLLALQGCDIHKEKYHVRDPIGHGFYGTVLRATNNFTGKAWALKLVTNQNAAKVESYVTEMLKKSSESNRFLCIPIEIFTGTVDGLLYKAFVMDVLTVDLSELCFKQQMKFPPKTVVSVLAQTASALTHLNKSGFEHYDVKPSNIMLKKFSVRSNAGKGEVVTPEVCLIDLNECISIGRFDVKRLPDTRYRAPELVLGLRHNESVDCYSLGVVALELLENKAFFEFDCQGEAKRYEHLSRIQSAFGPLPDWLWESSPLNRGRLPQPPPIQRSMGDIVNNLNPATSSTTALWYSLPCLLNPDPTLRSTPEKALGYFQDVISDM